MTHRPFRAAAALAFILLIASAALLSSCSSRLGWGVVRWTSPDGSLPAGSIVPVYIKSNIEKVYVVGVPSAKGKDKGKKVEIPLWQLTLLSSKGKAEAYVKAMGENVSLYMTATRNRLPVRDVPASSSSKTVFWLREGESVKILEKVPGEVVSTGGEALSGSWYRVLTNDGTEGYAFSYAFRVYDESKEGPPVIAAKKEPLSGRVDLFFSRTWRPEYFQEMLDDNRVDLDYFSLRYGIFVDAIRKQVRIELPAASELFVYSDIVESKGVYQFKGTRLSIKIESDTRLECSWTAPLPASQGEDSTEAGEGLAAPSPVSASAEPGTTGASGSAAFVVLASEARDVIRLEGVRRQKLLTSFVDEAGASWAGEGIGKLVINKNGRFSWKDRGEAASSFLPPAAGSSGEIAFRLFLDPSLASAWEGAFSLRFDPVPDASGAVDANQERPWVDFLYRSSPAGLVLASAAESNLIAKADAGKADSLILAAASE